MEFCLDSQMGTLGCPIPLDEHAVSVSLPEWRDVIGYEEGEKRVHDVLKIGYPRFKLHASVELLINIFHVKRTQMQKIPCGHTYSSWYSQTATPVGHTHFSWMMGIFHLQ